MTNITKCRYANITMVFFYFFLLITILAIFIPLSPLMPERGLDPSWAFSINQAIAQNLVFGKDIVFTYGPYASIYTRYYHPATDNLMVYGSLILGLCFGCSLIYLAKKSSSKWLLIFVLTLTVLTIPKGLYTLTRDALFFLYPLIISLIVYRLTLPKDSNKKLEINKYTPFIIGVLFSPFGLLPLIKSTLIIICLAETMLCFSIFWYKKQKNISAIILISFPVSMILFWILTGQPISGLSSYLINVMPIISGYTDSMAIGFEPEEIIFYILASTAILSIIATAKSSSFYSKFFLFSSVGLFLFLAFKAGFIRHDGHAIICGIAVITATFLLPFVLEHTQFIKVFVFSVFTWAIFDQSYIKTSTKTIFDNIKNTYISAYAGLESRVVNNHELYNAFNKKIDSLKLESQLPNLTGTTDIYSYDQADLIASGNQWRPRPVFQSYSTYTPKLAQINASCLISKNAPDNIIFKIQTIDARFPSQDDGLSWPILLANYSPLQSANDYLVLKKNTDVTIPEKIEFLKKEFKFDSDIAIPDSVEPLFAEIEIKPTLLGRLFLILYKPLSHIKIKVELENGTKEEYRIIPGMASSGFIISPFIDNAKDFSLLYNDKNGLNAKKIKTINIFEKGLKSLFWNAQYTLTLSKLKFNSHSDNS